jgi:hypothetical protein
MVLKKYPIASALNDCAISATNSSDMKAIDLMLKKRFYYFRSTPTIACCSFYYCYCNLYFVFLVLKKQFYSLRIK